MRFALILIMLFLCLTPVMAQKRRPLSAVSHNFVVNSGADSHDLNPGNGVCNTIIAGSCTLRAAVEEANASVGADTITISHTGIIILATGLSGGSDSGLTITSDITINGPGATALTIQPRSGDRLRLFNIAAGATVTISDVTISGGLPRDAGDDIPHCHQENIDGLDGGGIFNSGTLTLNRVVVSGNRASDGGDCSGGQGGRGGSGGGIFNAQQATLNLVDSTVRDNTAGSGGDYLEIVDPFILAGDGGDGGGISNDGTLNVVNSTINNNQSGKGGRQSQFFKGSKGGDGGGIFNFSGAVLRVTNGTISGNRTGDGGKCVHGTSGAGGNGAGINNRDGGTLVLSNSTVSFNITGDSPTGGCASGGRGDGGGIDFGPSVGNLVSSSIISNNSAEDGPDVRGQIGSRGYTLIHQVDNHLTLLEVNNPGTNLTLVDPRLQPLADNGGPTMTHAIRANSPAVDKGRNFALDLSGFLINADQRGQPRPTDLIPIPNGINGDGSDIGAYELTVAPVQPGELIISEFRTNGPGGAADDYVEIHNATNSDINVLAVDNSAGFLVHTTANRNCLIPNGSVIKAHGNFLCAGSGYSLAAVATPDATFNGDVLDNAGIALFPMSQQLVANAALDRAAPSGSVFGSEGTVLPSFTSAPTAEHAWLRDLASGTPRDTNDNAADFRLVSPGGGIVGGLQATLGAPGPAGLGSPIDVTSMFGVSLLDPAAAPTAAPNRVRDLTPNAANNSTFGTLSIRRRFVNNTGGPVTRLRFRVINITGFPVTEAAAADVRAITSVDAVINGNMVRGLTLDTPPAQVFGGGLNSTLSINTPLANGESISVEFRLGVQKTGNFRFYVNVEALP